MQYFGGAYLSKIEFAKLTLPVMLAIPASIQGSVSEQVIYDLLTFSEVMEAIAETKKRRDIVSKTRNLVHSLAVLMEGYNLTNVFNLDAATQKEFMGVCPKLVDFAATCTRDDIQYGLAHVHSLLGVASEV